MANPLLEIKLVWQEVPTTCEPCSACTEIIYGKQYQMFTEPGGQTETILCRACYEAIKQ
jgi:hypothetical protein